MGANAFDVGQSLTVWRWGGAHCSARAAGNCLDAAISQVDLANLKYLLVGVLVVDKGVTRRGITAEIDGLAIWGEHWLTLLLLEGFTRPLYHQLSLLLQGRNKFGFFLG